LSAVESVNFIWGQAVNPWDPNRTTGGSSGGEGGLISMGGSPLGLGTDVIGSTRIPAIYCGICGFRPTSGRYTSNGGISTTSEQTGVKVNMLGMPAIGPMGKCTADLELMVKTLIDEDTRKTDPFTPFLPYKAVKLNQQLKIGYVESEYFIGSCASVKRAVSECAASLKSKGHDLVPIQLPRFEELMLAFVQLIQADDQADGLFKKLEDEEVSTGMKKIASRAKWPQWMFRVLGLVLSLQGEHRAKKLLDNSYTITSNELWLKFSEIMNYRNEFLAFWKQNQFDAIITPATITPAVPHGASEEFATFIWSFTVYCSMLNLPAGVIPTTLVRSEEENYVEDKNSDMYTKFINKALKGSTGCPVGVQIITLQYEDEKCLEIMKLVEQTANLKELIEHNLT
jgi:fatty acid amide hydrolase